MQLAQILVKLWKLRIWAGVGVLLATVAAVASLTMFHSAVYATASTQMLVDSPQSALADAGADLSGYIARAVVFARLMTAPGALQYIGQAAGVPGNLIAAAGPVELAGPNATHSPTAVQGGHLVWAPSHYKLDFLQNPELPTVDVYAEAPTTKQAIALANGAVNGFGAYIADLEARNTIPAGHRIEVRQLGGATGGVVDAGASKTLAAMVFVAVLVLWCGLVLLVPNLRGQLRAAQITDPGGALHVPQSHDTESTPPAPQDPFPLLNHPPAGSDSGACSDSEVDDFVSGTSYSTNHAGDRKEQDDLRRGVRLRP
jgi:hypothetical protein